MTLRFTDTMQGRKVEFVPIREGEVGLYTCGPTVWNFAHIGNFRGNLFYDLLKRHLEFSGYRVTHVMNITDIDDRILHEAGHTGETIQEYTRRYEQAFFEDLATLRFRPATVYPRATEHIADIEELVSGLIERGHAYTADDGVYFRVASFPEYGKLAHIDLGGLRAGARVATDKYEKETASDFALWKAAADKDAALGARWEAPFGAGRPGWHIECSAMAMRYLGQTLDIHCGGVDLKFPHHENEIAQSEAFTGRTFARYWLHNDHLADASGEKMSKSVGNISTLRELLAAGHDPLAVRFFLLAMAHYRSPLRYEGAGLHAAAEQVRRLRDFSRRLEAAATVPGDAGALGVSAREARVRYREALDDDLNLPQAVGFVFDTVRDGNAALDRGPISEGDAEAVRALLGDADAHLDVLTGGEAALDADVEALIERRQAARAARDFAESDRIRDQLRERGIELEDTKEGVRWRRIPG